MGNLISGHGEEALETSKDFSRYGRVNHVLQERQRCLNEVDRLRDSLGEIGDVSYSCENAGYFYRYTLVRSWDGFTDTWEKAKQEHGEGISANFVHDNFPFARYFAPADGSPLFSGRPEEDWVIAQRCWKYIQQLFKKLEEFIAFELLRNARDRADYLLVSGVVKAVGVLHLIMRRLC